MSIFINYLNIILVFFNISLVLYFKYLNTKIKKLVGINTLSNNIRVIVDGILVIEILYFWALYVWMNSGASEALGGISEPCEYLYVIAEYVKSLYFTTIMLGFILTAKHEFQKINIVNRLQNKKRLI